MQLRIEHKILREGSRLFVCPSVPSESIEWNDGGPPFVPTMSQAARLEAVERCAGSTPLHAKRHKHKKNARAVAAERLTCAHPDSLLSSFIPLAKIERKNGTTKKKAKNFHLSP